MTLTRKLSLTLLAALTLSACQAEPAPINPNSDATFGIHAVLYGADEEPATGLPSGVLLGEDVEAHEDDMGKTLYIRVPPLIDTACLKSIEAVDTEYSGPALAFDLTADCAEKFGRFTARNVGKRMALTINGEMTTAPFIRSAITGGGGIIDGGFETLAEAKAAAKSFYE